MSCHASAAVAGMAVGMMVSGSDFTLLVSASASAAASSGVDSLIEMSGGGGIFSTSSSDVLPAVLMLRMLPAVLAVFLLLPLGAGSRFGVALLYVTVLVTTLRTLTGLGQALRGVVIDSNILLEVQSAGENGEYRAL